MQTIMVHQFIFAALLVLLSSSASGNVNGDEIRTGSLPQVSFYHRFSPQAKERFGKTGAVFPPVNTPEYHRLLVHSDRVRHGRNLAAAPGGSLTFSLGNLTIISTDALHYALINVGTPGVSHFVALDTGSDMFWLPCECIACAPTSSPYFQGLPSLNVYSPSKSTTSKVVSCASSSCDSDFSTCGDKNLPTSGQCQYSISYATANTTTSGTVYQDAMHFTLNNGAGKDITTPITVGCGQTQTGSLVDGSSVPDGLIGLGRRPYSVPSVLAQSGLVGDSFSMCFAFDGSGRIVFGDFGSSAVQTTPLQQGNTSTYPHYVVGVDSITVGKDTIPVNDVTLVDTGASTSFLSSTVYKAVTDSFVKQVTKYQRVVFDKSYDVCYQTGDYNVTYPNIDFGLSGPATFQVISPLLPYFYASNASLAGFCLAVLDGGSVNVLGANFMVGYNLIFNRQASTLGYEPSSCYSSNTSSIMSKSGSPTLAPSPPSPVPTSDSTTPGPLVGGIVPGAPGGGNSPKQGGSGRTQRISVPLLSILVLGLLVNFLSY